MSNLFKKLPSFEWIWEAKASFDEIKQALVKASALALPASEGKFALDTDASTLGIAVPWNEHKVLRPIYYGSHALHPTQKNQGVPKLEMLAVVIYVKTFHS